MDQKTTIPKYRIFLALGIVFLFLAVHEYMNPSTGTDKWKWLHEIIGNAYDINGKLFAFVVLGLAFIAASAISYRKWIK